MTKFKTIYISNSISDATLCERAHVNYFMVDLEILGKEVRQKGRNTLISRHTIENVSAVRPHLKSTKLLVRVNPINVMSEHEINVVIEAGADAVMLPMARTSDEVAKFLRFVDGRAETILLVETAAAFIDIENIVSGNRIDRIHLGLNDLHLELKLKFMFQVFASDAIFFFKKVLHLYGIPFGVGGIAPIGHGLLSSEVVLPQHRLVGSDCAILSRDFKKAIDECSDETEKLDVFKAELNKLYVCFGLPIANEELCRKNFKKAVHQLVTTI